ncbi:hypothetical protein Sango_0655500 [Sesamum angolense]|uniref:Reverse transcriptase Ty1/copia-type domain-containing protein n=1 Tax=Sesamum angolense TaxID=2727404 RepID=A0AAE2C2N8_9LAMI|nr:hypothetical protein Sango_0655500 [Sesamum angolense]
MTPLSKRYLSQGMQCSWKEVFQRIPDAMNCSFRKQVKAPQSNAKTTSAPTVSTDNVPILRWSARVPQPPERYGFLGVTGQLDNDPKTYGEAISDIDSEKWLETMKSEMDSMSSNQIWTLVDRPKGARPVGYKWSINMDVKTAFLNGFVEEEIYMDQPEGFTVVGE